MGVMLITNLAIPKKKGTTLDDQPPFELVLLSIPSLTVRPWHRTSRMSWRHIGKP